MNWHPIVNKEMCPIPEQICYWEAWVLWKKFPAVNGLEKQWSLARLLRIVFGNINSLEHSEAVPSRKTFKWPVLTNPFHLHGSTCHERFLHVENNCSPKTLCMNCNVGDMAESHGWKTRFNVAFREDQNLLKTAWESPRNLIHRLISFILSLFQSDWNTRASVCASVIPIETKSDTLQPALSWFQFTFKKTSDNAIESDSTLAFFMKPSCSRTTPATCANQSCLSTDWSRVHARVEPIVLRLVHHALMQKRGNKPRVAQALFTLAQRVLHLG